jgi:branched-chain amino acid transport system substrate-binding protein
MHAISRRIVIGLLGVASFACGSCGKKSDDLTVGAYLSLSGSDSTFGSDTRDGIELAVLQTNASGGVKGKKVRVIYEDDKSTPAEATNKVRQLIDRDAVLAVLGEVASSRSMAGAIIANSKKIPMVTPSSTADEITKDREWVFRACYTNAQQGDVAAHFIHDKLKKTRVGLFYVAQDNYSSGLAQSFKDTFVKLGGQIILEKGYPAKETNFTTFLEAFKAVSPEAIFVPNYYNDMVQIARQAKNVGIPGSIFVGGDGWDSEDLIQGAGTELEGAHFTNGYASDVPWENSRLFLRTFKEKYGHDPGSLSAQGYDAARLLFDAMGRAPDLTPEAIKNALATTKDFAGATGTLTIDKGHNANKPIVIVQVKAKKFTYVDQLFAQ